VIPAHRPGRHKGGYFPCAPADRYNDLRAQMVKDLESVGVPVEKHHHEVATAGQTEVDIRLDSLTSRCDSASVRSFS